MDYTCHCYIYIYIAELVVMNTMPAFPVTKPK